MAIPPLNSYPTHTRSSHPGWYSRLTYLHSVPEVFNTYDSVNAVYYDMFVDQFSTADSSKGNYEWPPFYWKTGMHQRIKGAFQIVSEVDTYFNMTAGIKNDRGNILSSTQNSDGADHVFETDSVTCLVNFEWNICAGPVVTADPTRRMYMSVHGFYHYEDGLSGYNRKYHHIPFNNATDSYRCIDDPTWPYMLIKPENQSTITLLNLTIEELGG
jgi:hypothetical protein